MNKLNVIYCGKNNNFNADEISLVISGNNMATKVLLSHLVDLSELISWFESNYEQIKSTELPINIIDNKSIANSIYSYYKTMEDDNNILIEAMYHYRRCHGLRFGMRGVDIPDIYLGKNGSAYEISLYNEGENWSYYFDLEVFYSSIRKLQKFV